MAQGAGVLLFLFITRRQPLCWHQDTAEWLSSVKLPSDGRLCKKMEKINVTITEVYPSCSSETSGLLNDQPSAAINTKAPEKKDFFSWSSDAAKLNSCFSRVAKHSLPSAPSSLSEDETDLPGIKSICVTKLLDLAGASQRF